MSFNFHPHQSNTAYFRQGLYQNALPGSSAAYSYCNQPSGYIPDSHLRFVMEAPEEATAVPSHMMLRNSMLTSPYQPQHNYGYGSGAEAALRFGNPIKVGSTSNTQLYSPSYSANDFSGTLTDDDLRSLKIPSPCASATLSKSYESNDKNNSTKSFSKSATSAFKSLSDQSLNKKTNTLLSIEQQRMLPRTPAQNTTSKKPEAFIATSKASVMESNKTTQEVIPPAPSLRVLTGSVEKILKWEKIQKFVNLLYEVYGSLVSVCQGGKYCQKLLALRDTTGPVLQCVFYEIDRILPPLQPGDYVRCVGWFIGKNKMQIVSVREALPAERESIRRLGFISQRAAQDIFDHSNQTQK